jgi:hypothetical protein
MLSLRCRLTALILIPILLALSFQVAIAHKQKVHQYIVREAYLLLMASAGGNIRELPNHIGDYGSFYIADSAWQRAFVTTGAWREDDEDVIYHYDFWNGTNYALVSWWSNLSRPNRETTLKLDAGLLRSDLQGRSVCFKVLTEGSDTPQCAR